jgi:hypothetical protein
MGLISSVVFSLIVYSVLTLLLVSQGVTIPISILMFTLLYGLTRYYLISEGQKDSQISNESGQNGIKSKSKIDENEAGSNILFLAIFVILVIICALISSENLSVFIPWDRFSGFGLIQLGAAIALAFFIPGYAVVLILTKNHKIDLVLKVLLGYIFSILITGLSIFLSAFYLDSDTSENKIILISVYLAIITVFIIYRRSYRIILNIKADKAFFHVVSVISNKLPKILLARSSELLVFGSLFGLLIISTYYVYGGVTIGDQWYHQGRALLFLSGNFKEVASSGEDTTYPPLQSALIAGLTSLTGAPLVNAYASIAFVNMTAVFAFYYFCKTWFPSNKKRAALIAATLFLLGSGFGWIYILYLANVNPIISPASSVATFTQERIEISDITLSSNFIISAFPDFSTALIYVSLTAGFLLLGLVRSKFDNRYKYTITLSILATTGLLFHGEFYIFIAVSCILPLAFNIKNGNYIYFAFLVSFAIVFILDATLPVKYFTLNEILGIPLITFNTIFVSILWAFYVAQQNLHRYVRSNLVSLIEHTKNVIYHGNRVSFIPRTIVVWAVIYVFALSFIVWTSLPTNYLQAQTNEFTTPWYLYPLRLGTIGLFGIAYILSYLFKRFQKEVFVFGIIALVAFIAGPYYNEHRFSKYVMVGMIGFASLLIFNLLIFVANKRPLILGIVVGSIVISSSLSSLMFIGYNALEVQNQLYTQTLARRDFPSTEQIGMFDLIRSKIQLGPNTYNVASFPKEYYSYGIMNKIHAFSGLPIAKIEQSPLILNSSTLDLFYHLLETSNTKFIMLVKNTVDEKKLPDPMRFALNNFQHIYEDSNYLILEVPSLRGPSSSDSGPAIVYRKDGLPSSVDSNGTNLQFNNATFELPKNTSKVTNLQIGNQSQTSTLYDSKNISGKNEWSKNFNISNNISNNDNVNYFQDKFRILSEDYKGNAVINWKEGDTGYQIRLRDGLELRQRSIGTNVLDNNLTTRWSSNGIGQFITSDLGSIQNICSVDIAWYNGNARQYHFVIATSTDGTTFTNKFSGDSSGTTLNSEKYVIPATDARYVRVTVNGNTVNTWASITELDVFGSSSPPVSCTTNLPITSVSARSFLLFKDAELYKNQGTWYLLKVASLKDSIDVYVNGERKIKVPKLTSEELPDISKVEIFRNNDAVEFGPIEVGKVSSSTDFYDKKQDYDFYYPLSLLALSRNGYSLFTDDDYAVFAKKKIILPFDPLDWTTSKFKDYLEYARSGGILVVMNSNNNFDGRFSKLLSVEPTINKTTEYTKILEENSNQILNISGMERNAEVEPSSDTKTLASYRNNVNGVIAPFVIEKDFPNGGKIILVNAKGYYDTIYANPKKYFLILQNLTGLLSINPDRTFVPQEKIEPTKRFIGDMEISGESSINSSSFSLVDGSSNSANLKSKAISIFYKDEEMNRHYNNISIANVKLFGQFKVVINSIGNIILPFENSQHDYIETRLPNGFNMTLQPLNKYSSAEIVTRNKTSLDSIKVGNESKIEFYKINSGSASPNTVRVLIKAPDIISNGSVSFNGANFDGELPGTNPPLKLAGQVKAKLDFVDQYNDKANQRGATRGQYLTYLKSLTGDDKTEVGKLILIPGDISTSAKENKLNIPLNEILSSSINILILIVSVIISLIVAFSFRRARTKTTLR